MRDLTTLTILRPTGTDGPATDNSAPSRPHLRLIPGGAGGDRSRPDVRSGRRSTPTGRARLRRRRMVAALLLIATALAVNRVGAVPGSSPLGPPARTAGSELRVVAEPGDSLWSIVRRIAPGRDPRPLVHELAAERGGAEVRVGDVITVRR